MAACIAAPHFKKNDSSNSFWMCVWLLLSTWIYIVCVRACVRACVCVCVCVLCVVMSDLDVYVGADVNI